MNLLKLVALSAFLVAPVMLAAEKAKEAVVPAEIKNESSDDALLRYIVAIIEKKGIGKKESCSRVILQDWVDGKVWLQMRCPRASTFGGAGNVVLNELYDKKFAEKFAKYKAAKNPKQVALDAKKKLLEKEQGFLSELDKAQFQKEQKEIDGSTFIDRQFGDVFDDIEKDVSIHPWHNKWWGSSEYYMYASVPKAQYAAIAKSLHEEEKAALKLQEEAAAKEVAKK